MKMRQESFCLLKKRKMIVKLDFDRIYPIEFEKGTINEATFTTTLNDGRRVKIKMEISVDSHALFENVFNLAFGPMDHYGGVQDRQKLEHADYSMVFSTVLAFAKLYLEQHPGHFLGLDGSTNSRAGLYYRMIFQNYDYLTRYFKAYGANYYVRIARREGFDNPHDYSDIWSNLIPLEKGDNTPSKGLAFMYNYFIFELKK